VNVRIDRVYTRSGDKGETGLVGGKRVAKNSLRVSAYGAIDELNAALGLVGVEISPNTQKMSELLLFLQQSLFDIGAELATPSDGEYEGMIKVGAEDVRELEAACDEFGKNLEPLSSFILPGGSRLGSALHMARTSCRRAEREILNLHEKEPVNLQLIAYLNRLSDLLFILCRWSLEQDGVEPPLWQKKSERS